MIYSRSQRWKGLKEGKHSEILKANSGNPVQGLVRYLKSEKYAGGLLWFRDLIYNQN